jgi:hypothetical protein
MTKKTRTGAKSGLARRMSKKREEIFVIGQTPIEKTSGQPRLPG